MAHFTLIPAYGRDYKSKKAAVADYMDGKDFMLAGIFYSGRMVSRRELAEGDIVTIRYKQRTMAVCVNALTGKECL